MFLDFISYSAGPLPRELLDLVSCPVSILWGAPAPHTDPDQQAGFMHASTHPMRAVIVPVLLRVFVSAAYMQCADLQCPCIPETGQYSLLKINVRHWASPTCLSFG